jgi:hypothetical protein
MDRACGRLSRVAHRLDRGYEAVASRRNGLDEHRTLRHVAQRQPDLADRAMDARLDIHEHVFAPQPIDNLVAGYELGASLDEQDEEIHGPPLQVYGSASATELVIANVEREVAKSNDAA